MEKGHGSYNGPALEQIEELDPDLYISVPAEVFDGDGELIGSFDVTALKGDVGSLEAAEDVIVAGAQQISHGPVEVAEALVHQVYEAGFDAADEVPDAEFFADLAANDMLVDPHEADDPAEVAEHVEVEDSLEAEDGAEAEAVAVTAEAEQVELDGAERPVQVVSLGGEAAAHDTTDGIASGHENGPAEAEVVARGVSYTEYAGGLAVLSVVEVVRTPEQAESAATEGVAAEAGQEGATAVPEMHDEAGEHGLQDAAAETTEQPTETPGILGNLATRHATETDGEGLVDGVVEDFRRAKLEVEAMAAYIAAAIRAGIEKPDDAELAA